MGACGGKNYGPGGRPGEPEIVVGVREKRELEEAANRAEEEAPRGEAPEREDELSASAAIKTDVKDFREHWLRGKEQIPAVREAGAGDAREDAKLVKPAVGYNGPPLVFPPPTSVSFPVCVGNYLTCLLLLLATFSAWPVLWAQCGRSTSVYPFDQSKPLTLQAWNCHIAFLRVSNPEDAHISVTSWWLNRRNLIMTENQDMMVDVVEDTSRWLPCDVTVQHTHLRSLYVFSDAAAMVSMEGGIHAEELNLTIKRGVVRIQELAAGHAQLNITEGAMSLQVAPLRSDVGKGTKLRQDRVDVISESAPVTLRSEASLALHMDEGTASRAQLAGEHLTQHRFTTYEPVLTDMWCDDGKALEDYVIHKGHGANETAQAKACQDLCTSHDRCKFYLFGEITHWQGGTRCATFSSCDHKKPYLAGEPHIHEKVSTRLHVHLSSAVNAAGDGLDHGSQMAVKTSLKTAGLYVQVASSTAASYGQSDRQMKLSEYTKQELANEDTWRPAKTGFLIVSMVALDPEMPTGIYRYTSSRLLLASLAFNQAGLGLLSILSLGTLKPTIKYVPVVTQGVPHWPVSSDQEKLRKHLAGLLLKELHEAEPGRQGVLTYVEKGSHNVSEFTLDEAGDVLETHYDLRLSWQFVQMILMLLSCFVVAVGLLQFTSCTLRDLVLPRLYKLHHRQLWQHLRSCRSGTELHDRRSHLWACSSQFPTPCVLLQWELPRGLEQGFEHVQVEEMEIKSIDSFAKESEVWEVANIMHRSSVWRADGHQKFELWSPAATGLSKQNQLVCFRLKIIDAVGRERHRTQSSQPVQLLPEPTVRDYFKLFAPAVSDTKDSFESFVQTVLRPVERQQIKRGSKYRLLRFRLDCPMECVSFVKASQIGALGLEESSGGHFHDMKLINQQFKHIGDTDEYELPSKEQLLLFSNDTPMGKVDLNSRMTYTEDGLSIDITTMDCSRKQKQGEAIFTLKRDFFKQEREREITAPVAHQLFHWGEELSVAWRVPRQVCKGDRLFISLNSYKIPTPKIDVATAKGLDSFDVEAAKGFASLMLLPASTSDCRPKSIYVTIFTISTNTGQDQAEIHDQVEIRVTQPLMLTELRACYASFCLLHRLPMQPMDEMLLRQQHVELRDAFLLVKRDERLSLACESPNEPRCVAARGFSRLSFQSDKDALAGQKERVKLVASHELCLQQSLQPAVGGMPLAGCLVLPTLSLRGLFLGLSKFLAWSALPSIGLLSALWYDRIEVELAPVHTPPSYMSCLVDASLSVLQALHPWNGFVAVLLSACLALLFSVAQCDRRGWGAYLSVAVFHCTLRTSFVLVCMIMLIIVLAGFLFPARLSALASMCVTLVTSVAVLWQKLDELHKRAKLHFNDIVSGLLVQIAGRAVQQLNDSWLPDSSDSELKMTVPFLERMAGAPGEASPAEPSLRRCLAEFFFTFQQRRPPTELLESLAPLRRDVVDAHVRQALDDGLQRLRSHSQDGSLSGMVAAELEVTLKTEKADLQARCTPSILASQLSSSVHQEFSTVVNYLNQDVLRPLKDPGNVTQWFEDCPHEAAALLCAPLSLRDLAACFHDESGSSKKMSSESVEERLGSCAGGTSATAKNELTESGSKFLEDIKDLGNEFEGAYNCNKVKDPKDFDLHVADILVRYMRTCLYHVDGRLGAEDSEPEHMKVFTEDSKSEHMEVFAQRLDYDLLDIMPESCQELRQMKQHSSAVALVATMASLLARCLQPGHIFVPLACQLVFPVDLRLRARLMRALSRNWQQTFCTSVEVALGIKDCFEGGVGHHFFGTLFASHFRVRQKAEDRLQTLAGERMLEKQVELLAESQDFDSKGYMSQSEMVEVLAMLLTPADWKIRHRQVKAAARCVVERKAGMEAEAAEDIWIYVRTESWASRPDSTSAAIEDFLKAALDPEGMQVMSLQVLHESELMLQISVTMPPAQSHLPSKGGGQPSQIPEGGGDRLPRLLSCVSLGRPSHEKKTQTRAEVLLGQAQMKVEKALQDLRNLCMVCDWRFFTSDIEVRGSCLLRILSKSADSNIGCDSHFCFRDLLKMQRQELMKLGARWEPVEKETKPPENKWKRFEEDAIDILTELLQGRFGQFARPVMWLGLHEAPRLSFDSIEIVDMKLDSVEDPKKLDSVEYPKKGFRLKVMKLDSDEDAKERAEKVKVKDGAQGDEAELAASIRELLGSQWFLATLPKEMQEIRGEDQTKIRTVFGSGRSYHFTRKTDAQGGLGDLWKELSRRWPGDVPQDKALEPLVYSEGGVNHVHFALTKRLSQDQSSWLTKQQFAEGEGSQPVLAPVTIAWTSSSSEELQPVPFGRERLLRGSLAPLAPARLGVANVPNAGIRAMVDQAMSRAAKFRWATTSRQGSSCCSFKGRTWTWEATNPTCAGFCFTAEAEERVAVIADDEGALQLRLVRKGADLRVEFWSEPALQDNSQDVGGEASQSRGEVLLQYTLQEHEQRNGQKGPRFSMSWQNDSRELSFWVDHRHLPEVAVDTALAQKLSSLTRSDHAGHAKSAFSHCTLCCPLPQDGQVSFAVQDGLVSFDALDPADLQVEGGPRGKVSFVPLDPADLQVEGGPGGKVIYTVRCRAAAAWIRIWQVSQDKKVKVDFDHGPAAGAPLWEALLRSKCSVGHWFCEEDRYVEPPETFIMHSDEVELQATVRLVCLDADRLKHLSRCNAFCESVRQMQEEVKAYINTIQDFNPTPSTPVAFKKAKGEVRTKFNLRPLQLDVCKDGDYDFVLVWPVPDADALQERIAQCGNQTAKLGMASFELQFEGWEVDAAKFKDHLLTVSGALRQGARERTKLLLTALWAEVFERTEPVGKLTASDSEHTKWLMETCLEPQLPFQYWLQSFSRPVFKNAALESFRTAEDHLQQQREAEEHLQQRRQQDEKPCLATFSEASSHFRSVLTRLANHKDCRSTIHLPSGLLDDLLCQAFDSLPVQAVDEVRDSLGSSREDLLEFKLDDLLQSAGHHFQTSARTFSELAPQRLSSCCADLVKGQLRETGTPPHDELASAVATGCYLVEVLAHPQPDSPSEHLRPLGSWGWQELRGSADLLEQLKQTEQAKKILEQDPQLEGVRFTLTCRERCPKLWRECLRQLLEKSGARVEPTAEAKLFPALAGPAEADPTAEMVNAITKVPEGWTDAGLVVFPKGVEGAVSYMHLLNVDFDRFKKMMQELRISLDDHTLQAIFDAMDMRGDGYLDAVEFLEGLPALTTCLQSSVLTALNLATAQIVPIVLKGFFLLILIFLFLYIGMCSSSLQNNAFVNTIESIIAMGSGLLVVFQSLPNSGGDGIAEVVERESRHLLHLPLQDRRGPQADAQEPLLAAEEP